MGRPVKVPEVVVPPVIEPVIEYSIEVTLGNTTISNSAETMYEALKGLPRPEKIMNKGFITVRHGDKVKNLHFMPAAMKRIFYPIAYSVNAKMLAMNL